MPRKPRPLNPKLPGQKAKPTANQKRKPPKQPWERGVKVVERIGRTLNPFD